MLSTLLCGGCDRTKCGHAVIPLVGWMRGAQQSGKNWKYEGFTSENSTKNKTSAHTHKYLHWHFIQKISQDVNFPNSPWAASPSAFCNLSHVFHAFLSVGKLFRASDSNSSGIKRAKKSAKLAMTWKMWNEFQICFWVELRIWVEEQNCFFLWHVTGLLAASWPFQPSTAATHRAERARQSWFSEPTITNFSRPMLLTMGIKLWITCGETVRRREWKVSPMLI